MVDRPRDERTIFRIAFSIQSEELRDEYLRQICGTDGWLRDRVVQLLQAGREDPEFLEVSPIGIRDTADRPPIEECPGTRVGYQSISIIWLAFRAAKEHNPYPLDIGIRRHV